MGRNLRHTHTHTLLEGNRVTRAKVFCTPYINNCNFLPGACVLCAISAFISQTLRHKGLQFIAD